MNKKRLIYDRSLDVLKQENVRFSSRPRGHVKAYVQGTDIPLFEGDNNGKGI